MNHKTSGIVLKRSNLGEADRLLTILTERFGKIKAIAKGARKIKSRLAGSLEPFNLVDLQLYEGKTFYTVTGAVIEKEYSIIHSDLGKLSFCFYLGEMVDKFFEENQKSSFVFINFVKALDHLETKKKSDLLVKTLCLEIIEEAGFKPQILNCVHCHEEIKEEENFWDSSDGGIICGNCKSKSGHGKLISNNGVKALRLMERKDFSIIEKISLDEKLNQEIENILDEYISRILERDLKSKRFIADVKNL